MDLRQIEYFVRVAELGSFTRASVVLGIAQPALSRQVRLLEVELRQSLLLRNGRGATPTEAGQLLLKHGRSILHQVARAREELGRVRGALAGRVAIGLPPSIAKVVTVPLTRAFRAQLPDAALAISEGLSVAMQELLTTGLLDIVLLYNTASGPGMETTALLEEDLFLVQRRTPPPAPGREGNPGAWGKKPCPGPGPAAPGSPMPRPWPRRRCRSMNCPASRWSSPRARTPSACWSSRNWPPGASARRSAWKSTAWPPSSTWWPMAPAAPCCR